MSRYGAGGPLAIAHRGGAALAPENTVAAFERSLALGYRYLETDVRVTADGVCVAFHDRGLRRVTGVTGRVADLSWDDVRSLRVLGREPVPRLDDLLTRWPDVRWVLDVKQPEALSCLVATVRDCGAASRVCLSGTWDRWLGHARRALGPDVTTALGWRSLVSLLRGASPRPDGAGFAHVPLRFAGRRLPSARLVERAQALGLRVVVWGVDDRAEMHRLLDDGVAGVITDRTDVLREVLVARDAWTAPADDVRAPDIRVPEARAPEVRIH